MDKAIPDASCLICANLIDPDSDRTRRNLFENGTDLKALPNTLCCSLCITTMSDCVNILRQMNSLQLGLKTLKMKLQNDLVTSYHGLSGPSTVEEDPFSPENMSKSQVRKALVQCFKLSPITSTTSQNMNSKDNDSRKGTQPLRQCSSQSKPTPMKNSIAIRKQKTNDNTYENCDSGISIFSQIKVEQAEPFEQNSDVIAATIKVESDYALFEEVEAPSAPIESISDSPCKPMLNGNHPIVSVADPCKIGVDYEGTTNNSILSSQDGQYQHLDQGQHAPPNKTAQPKKILVDCSKKYTKTYECTYCKGKYVEKDFYVPETGKLVIKCDLPNCTRKFSHFQSFSRHHETTCYKKPPPGKFKCGFCGKQCFNARTLKDHEISIHTKQFEYFCDFCGLGYVSKASLRSHVNFCHKEKKHQCHLCPMIYKSKTMLNVHLRRHNGELPYMCVICGKRMVSYNKLKRHETIHIEVPKFPCPICNKRFKNRDYVRNHIWSFHNRKIPVVPLRIREREPGNRDRYKQDNQSASCSDSTKEN